MKNLLAATFSLLTVTLVFNACSKKHDDKPSCKLITISVPSGTSTTTYNITYDNQGRISTINSSDGTTTTNKILTYDASNISITTTSGSSSNTDAISLNSAGFPLTDVHTDGSNITTTTYTYDNDNQLQKVVSQENSDAPQTQTFTYSNGDVVSGTSGSTSATYSYDVSKSAQPGDYLQVSQIVSGGLIYAKTKHLIIGVTQGSSISNFNYSYDTKGNISSVAITGGTTAETVSYQYMCN